MEKFMEIFKHLASTNTINFIVMVLLLGWILKKLNLSKAFEKGCENIKILLSKSDEEKAVAQKHLDSAKKLIDGLPEDIKTLERNSAEKIEIFMDEIHTSTKNSIDNLSVIADKAISIEEKKISNLLTESTSKQTVEQAREKLINMLGQNPELHDKFIENSVNELDKVKL